MNVDNPTNVFRFNVKFEYVENRSVRRSLDFEDDTDDRITWYVRCVPIGHSVMFYLCRNQCPTYYEFIYEYSTVNGDGDFEQGFNRRGMVDPSQLCEEYLEPTITIPVNPSKNWFLVQIKIQHLAENEYSNNLNITNGIDSVSKAVEIRKEKKEADEGSRLISLSLFSRRMFNMFMLQLNTDLTVNCPPKSFKAHKSVLSAGSVVFRTMFEHSFTRESLTSELLIEDFDYLAVLIMLQWLYGEEVSIPCSEIRTLYLSEHSCEPQQSTSAIEHECTCFELNDDLLLQCTELAHKYALDEMQFECEEKWTQRLNKSNVCNCLYYAEVFHLYGLKISCIEMIRQSPEIIEIQHEDWRRLVEWQPEIEKRVFSSIDQPSTSGWKES